MFGWLGGAASSAAAERSGGRRAALEAVRTADVLLVPTPIDPAWILDGGEPVTLAAELARTDDGTAAVYLWSTSRCRYRWEHASDEVVTVLEGEVFLIDEQEADDGSAAAFAARGARERRLGPGDVAFFPAGARTVWRVPAHLRKVSTLIRPLPGPLAAAMRAGRSAKRALRAAASQVRQRAGQPWRASLSDARKG